MPEPLDKPTSLAPGQVLGYKTQPGSKFILLERFYAFWPTWQSEGKFWQWRILDKNFKIHDVLENSIENMEYMNVF